MALIGASALSRRLRLLLLRAEAGEVDPEIAEWWTRFQDVDGAASARA
jgi:poly(A) polymerase